MKEKIIKWSSRKIIWNIVLCFVDLAFLLWILYFMMTYPKEAAIGLVALRLFVLFLIIIVGWLLYERIQILLSDKEYLKCTAQGFSYKPYPKKDWQFYSWRQVETFSLMRIKGGGSSRDFYQIEVCFFDKDLVKTKSLWNRLRSKFSSAKPAVDLIIPIHLLDVDFPRRVFETMSYFEREWRIKQNRQARKEVKQASKSKSSKLS
ncbi:hypothetical protein [Streptococcus oralis]|uniref:Uncharacterized protein n=1 Tax=Streptococcus oralis TaxID=1303 RepID=A0A3R9IXB9_STROR|nr:hypothetical protein [Streptococcus oralis]RSI66693.1 hypothetical protein D8862_02865 [Streptococcus oralis]